MADSKEIEPTALRHGHLLVDESGAPIARVLCVDVYTGGMVYAVTDGLSVEFPAGTMARVRVEVRKTDYSTAREDGMEFIANRWVFAGDKGYRVKFNANTGRWFVVAYTARSERHVYGTLGMSEDDAHAYAAQLANMPVHPAPEAV